jgi:pimeloyl-ACP methyl ester carboxylesterase
LPKLLGTIVGTFAVLGIVVPLLLVGSQRWTVYRARKTHPAPGRVIDIAGQQLHLYCDGVANPDEATIVIDADIAAFSLDWVAIQRALISDHRVCLVDRAGYGWSEAVGGERSAEQVVLELHTLLVASGEPAPYVLAGHGLGAVHGQLYAARYPEETGGLVLINPLTEEVLSETYSRGWQRKLDYYEQMRGLTASGLLKLVRPLVRATRPPWVRDLPEDVQDAYLALLLDRAYYETAIAETEMLALSLGQVRSALRGDLPLQGLPLVVLTAARSALPEAAPYAEETAATSEEIVAAHRAIAALSIRGERRMLGRSGPWVQVDAPEAVIAAMRDVVAMARVVGEP